MAKKDKEEMEEGRKIEERKERKGKKRCQGRKLKKRVTNKDKKET